MAFLIKISGRKLESSETRVFVRFPTLIFPFYKMLFMNRLEFSCFPDFFVWNFITREEYGFLLKSLVEGTVNLNGAKEWILLFNWCPRISSQVLPKSSSMWFVILFVKGKSSHIEYFFNFGFVNWAKNFDFIIKERCWKNLHNRCPLWTHFFQQKKLIVKWQCSVTWREVSFGLSNARSIIFLFYIFLNVKEFLKLTEKSSGGVCNGVLNQVVSEDYWGRQRVEGYGHLTLPTLPGCRIR